MTDGRKWCATTQRELIKLNLIKSYDTPIFVGTKEECKKFIKEHLNKDKQKANAKGKLPNVADLEKTIEELTMQIEKMKCPSCIWRDEKALYPTTDEAEYIICDDCKNHSKWEKAE